MENHSLSPSLNSIALMQCFYYFHTFSEILVILANMENTASMENLHKVRKSLQYQRLARVSLTQRRSRYSLKNLTSTSLISREMQIKTTVKNHFTLFRTAIIKKSTNSKCSRGSAKKEAPIHYQWEWKLVRLLWRRVWMFLKKSKNLKNLQYDSAIPL